MIREARIRMNAMSGILKIIIFHLSVSIAYAAYSTFPYCMIHIQRNL